MNRHFWPALVAVFITAGSTSAWAGIIVDFEALPGGAAAGSVYSGIGLSFSENAQGFVRREAGGTARFRNNPSGNTVLGWVDRRSMFINAETGMMDEIGLYYSSRRKAATLSIWSGWNGTGELLAEVRLPRNDNRRHENWEEILVPFTGTAYSVVLRGAPGTGIFLDNFSFTPAPLPAAAGLGAIGLATIAMLRRRLSR